MAFTMTREVSLTDQNVCCLVNPFSTCGACRRKYCEEHHEDASWHADLEEIICSCGEIGTVHRIKIPEYE